MTRLGYLRATLLGLVGASLALSSGCAGRYRRFQAQVEDQASVHLQCPVQQVSAERVGDRTWQVHACGAVVMYRCSRVPWVGMRCRNPGLQAQPVAVAQQQTVVVAPPQRVPQQTVVVPHATVTVQAAPQRAAPPRSRTIVVQRVQPPAPPAASAPPSAGLQAPAPAPAPAPAVVSASAEAVLAQVQPAIRACIGRAGTTVVVRWAADGMLQGSLDGPLAGSAADTCVRGLFSGVRISPLGTPGALMQEFPAY